MPASAIYVLLSARLSTRRHNAGKSEPVARTFASSPSREKITAKILARVWICHRPEPDGWRQSLLEHVERIHGHRGVLDAELYCAGARAGSRPETPLLREAARIVRQGL
jgi:hypothetical protein